MKTGHFAPGTGENEFRSAKHENMTHDIGTVENGTRQPQYRRKRVQERKT
jgi:hypothetical protein